MPEEDCPVCPDSESAKEQFAAAKVAEHIQNKAAHDDDHRRWMDEHTENGSLAEIRTALEDRQTARDR